jgi:hypothetical protein
MRTKSLLVMAAAMAAGVVASSAQSNVYSLNIVGYVNQVIAPGFNLIANPLSAGVSNGVNEIMSAPDAAIVATFNGVAYDTRTLDTGVWYDNAFNATTPPTLPPGRGFFFFNPGTAYTNTWVGTVVPDPGVTNSLSLPPGFSLVGSVMPVAATDITAAPVSLPAIDACIVSTFNGVAYDTRTLDTGVWYDNAFNAVAAPSYTVGKGFFYFNPGATAPWKQSLP